MKIKAILQSLASVDSHALSVVVNGNSDTQAYYPLLRALAIAFENDVEPLLKWLRGKQLVEANENMFDEARFHGLAPIHKVIIWMLELGSSLQYLTYPGYVYAISESVFAGRLQTENSKFELEKQLQKMEVISYIAANCNRRHSESFGMPSDTTAAHNVLKSVLIYRTEGERSALKHIFLDYILFNKPKIFRQLFEEYVVCAPATEASLAFTNFLVGGDKSQLDIACRHPAFREHKQELENYTVSADISFFHMLISPGFQAMVAQIAENDLSGFTSLAYSCSNKAFHSFIHALHQVCYREPNDRSFMAIADTVQALKNNKEFVTDLRSEPHHLDEILGCARQIAFYFRESEINEKRSESLSAIVTALNTLYQLFLDGKPAPRRNNLYLALKRSTLDDFHPKGYENDKMLSLCLNTQSELVRELVDVAKDFFHTESSNSKVLNSKTFVFYLNPNYVTSQDFTEILFPQEPSGSEAAEPYTQHYYHARKSAASHLFRLLRKYVTTAEYKKYFGAPPADSAITRVRPQIIESILEMLIDSLHANVNSITTENANNALPLVFDCLQAIDFDVYTVTLMQFYAIVEARCQTVDLNSIRCAILQSSILPIFKLPENDIATLLDIFSKHQLSTPANERDKNLYIILETLNAHVVQGLLKLEQSTNNALQELRFTVSNHFNKPIKDVIDGARKFQLQANLPLEVLRVLGLQVPKIITLNLSNNHGTNDSHGLHEEVIVEESSQVSDQTVLALLEARQSMSPPPPALPDIAVPLFSTPFVYAPSEHEEDAQNDIKSPTPQATFGHIIATPAKSDILPLSYVGIDVFEAPNAIQSPSPVIPPQAKANSYQPALSSSAILEGDHMEFVTTVDNMSELADLVLSDAVPKQPEHDR